MVNVVRLSGMLLLAGVVFVSGLTACSKQKEKAGGPSRATFAQREIRIGLIPEQNIFRQRERYDALGRYLSGKLGVKVEFTSLSRYGNIVERFSQEKLDGAFFGSFTYALARTQLDIEGLARLINPDGTSTYHGYIFVRKDSGIRSAASMRGKKFAFVERATSAGYLFPVAYFKKNGISDPFRYLGESYFTGTHDAAILAVLNKEADIGAAKNTVFDRMKADMPQVGAELTILATSALFPQNCLGVRKDLDPELKKALRRTLLEMANDHEGAGVLALFGAKGFVETPETDFSGVYQLASQAGIDIARYRYENK